MVERALVMIPTYNERESLPRQVDAVRALAPTVDILVIDDGSPDGTGEWTAERAAQDPQVHLMARADKQGLGAAYLAGMAWGLERGYDTLVEMDADGSHQARQLLDLLEVAGQSDLVIGSRWVSEGSVVNWPWHRKALSRTANTYARWALGLAVKDSTAGYRAYSAATLRDLDLGSVESQGYCFQIDMCWRVVKAGGVVREVPIEFVERTHGRSKMTSAIIGEALVKVTLWGLQRRGRQFLELFRRRGRS